MKKDFTINSVPSSLTVIKELIALFDEFGYLSIRVDTGKKRTPKQQASLQIYCREVARQLNEAGLSMQAVLAEGTEIPWTEESVKNQIWRKVQKALTNKESTTEPSTAEYPQIYDVVNNHLSTKFGIGVEWPHKGEE